MSGYLHPWDPKTLVQVTTICTRRPTAWTTSIACSQSRTSFSRAIHTARSHDGPTHVFTNSALPWRYPVPHHQRKQELFLSLQLVNFAVPACGVLSLQGCSASHDGWLFVAISTGGLSKSSLMNRNQTSPLMQQHLDDRCDVKPTVDRSAAYTGH